MRFYAHTTQDAEGRTVYTLADGCQTTAKLRLSTLAEEQICWQLLREHLLNVAVKARSFAAVFGYGEEAYAMGLLHDLGKYSEAFQLRLRGYGRGIDHWTVGALQAYGAKSAAGAFAIAGHHKGIPALCELQNLLKAYQRGTDLSPFGITEPSAVLAERAKRDGVTMPPPRGFDWFAKPFFTSALCTRLLFSCLVDADYLDTESHFTPAIGARRPMLTLRAEESLAILLKMLGAKPGIGEVNRRRRELLEECLSKAEAPRGLFTLTAPTGSGKTLSSLAFALRHIAYHNTKLAPGDPKRLCRIIVVIPYTTVIEQTAREYRKLFESQFGADYVLEHHSAVAPSPADSEGDRHNEEARQYRARLAAENWDAPIVVTTSVQFFESLFSNRPSDCRKLHNIVNSVVIFDEVQTLPPKLVPSLLSAVNLLVRDFGVSAVFGTATQPAFECASSAILGGWKPVSIASDPQALAETMRRTRVEIATRDRKMTWQEVAGVIAGLPQPRQALCVVNTTKDARTLFEALGSLTSAEECFHLSSRMCPAHRQAKLREIRRLSPAHREPCLLVSTQLIEAGVDVDFPALWRAMGPLDSIIQSAGRCNREGMSPNPLPVYVFRPSEGGLPRGAYQIAMQRTEAFLAGNPGVEQRLHLPETYRAYFACLYNDVGAQSAQDDAAFAASDKLQFPEAAEACRLIGQETRGVLVPMDSDAGGLGSWATEGVELIKAIRREHHLDGILARRCQRFTVNLYQGEFNRAEREGAIVPLTPDETVYAWASKYDEDLGAVHHSADELIL